MAIAASPYQQPREAQTQTTASRPRRNPGRGQSDVAGFFFFFFLVVVVLLLHVLARLRIVSRSVGRRRQRRIVVLLARSGGRARRIANYTGIFRDAYSGYSKLYEPRPLAWHRIRLRSGLSVHARRPFFVMADLAENARREAPGQEAGSHLALALEAVHQDGPVRRRADNQRTEHERRKNVRQELSAPLVADLEVDREQRAKLSRGNDVAKAL